MKKIILKYALAVLAVILFLFSGTLYFCNKTIIQRYTERDVINQIQARQELAAQMAQTLYQKVWTDANPFLKSQDIFALADGSEPLSSPLPPEQSIHVYNIIQQMQDRLVYNEAIRSIYIHFLDSDYIVGTEHYETSTEKFYDQNWIQQSEGMRKTGEFPLALYGFVSYQNPAANLTLHYPCVRYIFPFSTYLTNQRVLIVINYKLDALDEIFRIDPAQQTLVLNSAGELVYHSLENPEIEESLRENWGKIQEVSRTGSSMMLNDRYLLTFLQDDDENLLVNIAEYSSLFSKYDTLLLSIYGIVAGVVFLAGLAWYIATLQIYKPVSRAIHSIHRLSNTLKTQSPDNDVMIDKAVNKLVEHVKNTESLRQEQVFFDKVLVHARELQENQYLNRDYYQALCIRIDDIENFQWEAQTRELIQHLILEILAENRIQGIGKIVSQNSFEFLLSFDMPSGTFGDLIEDGYSDTQYYKQTTFRSIQQKLEEILDHTATIGVGDVYSSITSLPFSLEDARLRADRRILLGKNQIIYESEENVALYLPTEETHRLLKALEKQNAEEVQNILEQLKAEVHSGKIPISVEGTASFMGYLIFELSQFDAQKGGSFLDTGKLYQKAASLETFDEIIDYIDSVIQEYIQKYSSNISEKISILQKASRYIYANYQKDIDVNTIAENIGISYSRLRRMILDEFGINIVDYINTMRIKEAKKLLCSTSGTLPEIAAKVGYNNEQSLTRYFKKFENCSPGEYRKRAAQETQS